VAPAANGQAAIDQYRPSANPPAGNAGQVLGRGPAESDARAPLDASGGGGENVAGEAQSGSGGGELPFTGLPLTPFLLIAIALLAAGLLVRLAARLRQQIGSASGS
jgi:hypothetical protein